jgi:hemophore-related protein
MTSPLRRSVLAAGSVAVALLIVPAASASADPMMEALATTTCSYAQISAAVNAQTPDLAAQLNRPIIQANLQQFLAMPIDQRRATLAQQAANPQVQAILAAQFGPNFQQEIVQVANTCNTY